MIGWLRLLGNRAVSPPSSKPRVRIMPGGWIRHDGGPFPFDRHTLVEIALADGLILRGRDAEYASFWASSRWCWTADSWRHCILFYRLVDYNMVLRAAWPR